jgi:thioesterase domain-containing protein
LDRKGVEVSLEEITLYLHEQIPLTRHLGVAAEAWDGASVRLGAPLAPNLNHQGTAFGGSLSALAIISGWVLIHLALRERGLEVQLVIQRSQYDFEAPVDGDFTATSALPGAADWDRFLLTLKRHHRARVTVTTSLRSASGAGGTHRGAYVAMTVPAGSLAGRESGAGTS